MQHEKTNHVRKNRATSGFSLIELLIVCAILGILAVIGVSMMGGGRSQNIERAGNSASSLAQLARQHASSKNVLTALVVTPLTDGGESVIGMSVWDFDSALNGNQVERWTLLPNTVTNTLTNTTTVSPSPIGIKYRNTGVAGNRGNVIWFYPDGRVGDGSAIPRIKFYPSKGGQENYYELVFNPVIGTHKINRP